MWPWEHVLFAYVCYSLYAHARHRRRPTDAAVVVLAVGAVLPDLVDKPLAWQFGVFETGYAVAHSAFVAVPAVLAVAVLARRRGAGLAGEAFGIGYLLHLVGDVVPASASRRALDLSPVLWPVSDRVPIDVGGSLTGNTAALFRQYVTQLIALDLTFVVVLQLGSVAFGTVLWVLDGRPGLATVVTPVRRLIAFRNR